MKEFQKKRSALFVERDRMKERLKDHENHRAERWFELVEQTLKVAHYSRFRFNSGTPDQKRMILQMLGSNLILCDRKLHIKPVAPFSYLHFATKKSNWRTAVNHVETFG